MGDYDMNMIYLSPQVVNSQFQVMEAFCSHSEFHSPKLCLNHKHCKSPKPLPLISPLYMYKPQAVSFQQTTRLHFSSKSSLSPILHFPISNFSGNGSSLTMTPQKAFFKFLSEKVVIFLVGSFIFMGCFSVRPSLAVSAETTSSSVDMEEQKETQTQEEELLVRILEKDPEYALKVVFYKKMRDGKTRDAVKYVERLIDLKPDEVEWRLLQALCYETMGQLSKAMRLYKEILKKHPLLLRALHGLAMVMHKKHEDSAIFEMLNKALRIAQREKKVTEERSIKILIAQMHVIKGELVESLKEFQGLVKEDPRDFRPYLCQGIIYSVLEKEKEADEQFEMYRSLVPEEFPERGYLDDIMIAAKSSQKHLEEFKAQFSPRK